MAILSFQNIIEAEDITEEVVPVPEWGGEVVVRSISYRKMGKLKEQVAKKQGKSGDDVDVEGVDYERALLAAGLVEPEVTEDEAEMLMDKSASAVMKVLTAVMGSSKAEDDSVTKEEKSLSTES